MEELLFEYIEKADLESYLRVRDELFAHPDYNPYSNGLEPLRELLVGEEYHDAAEWLQQIIYPDYYLSPRAHFMLSLVYDKLGLTEESEVELLIGAHCLQGLEMTGDGSSERPILVTRISDAFDILNSRELEAEDQSLESVEDRRFEVITTTDGQRLWFDVTDVYGILRDIMAQIAEEPELLEQA